MPESDLPPASETMPDDLGDVLDAIQADGDVSQMRAEDEVYHSPNAPELLTYCILTHLSKIR